MAMNPKMFSRMASRIAVLMQQSGSTSSKMAPIDTGELLAHAIRVNRLLKLASYASSIHGVERAKKMAERSMRSAVGALSVMKDLATTVSMNIDSNRKSLEMSSLGCDLQTNLLRSFVAMHREGIQFDWIGSDPGSGIQDHLEVVVPPFIVEDKRRKIRVQYPVVKIRWFPTMPALKSMRAEFTDGIVWKHSYSGQPHAHFYSDVDQGNGLCHGESQVWISTSLPEGRFYDVIRVVIDILKDPSVTNSDRGSHDLVNDPRLEVWCEACGKWSKGMNFHENETPSPMASCCHIRLKPKVFAKKSDCFEWRDNWYPKSEGYEEKGMPMVPLSSVFVCGGKKFHPLKTGTCCFSGLPIGLVARGCKTQHYNHGIMLPDGRRVSVACLDIIEEELRSLENEGKLPEGWPVAVPGRWSRFVGTGPGYYGHGIDHYTMLARRSAKLGKPRSRKRTPAVRAAGKPAGASARPTRAGSIKAKAGTA